MLIIEDPTVTGRRAIQTLFLYFNFVFTCKIGYSLGFIYIHILSYQHSYIISLYPFTKISAYNERLFLTLNEQYA